VCKIADKDLKIKHLLDKPQGVRHRNADLILIKKTLNWQPKTSLEDGMTKLYRWIEKESHGS